MQEKLADFIQDYIKKSGWQGLNNIQNMACKTIFDDNTNMLISAPTASGKTEAAFLPVITELYNSSSAGLSCVYIAPLKALINDQFTRVREVLEYANIPITKWHSDVEINEKKRILKNPRGILEITPESLESLLLWHENDISRLFGGIKFIIIDEMHNFIQSVRGLQILSILQRIQNITNTMPRRIGLSATLGDIDFAKMWLNMGSTLACTAHVENISYNQSDIKLSYFYTKVEGQSELYEYILSILNDKKSIIFHNNRKSAENTTEILKSLNIDCPKHSFFVHHGKIDATNRNYIENFIKNTEKPWTVSATSTLELGVDVGGLSQVLQMNCPPNISSMAQRMGRANRKYGKPNIHCIFNEPSPTRLEYFYKDIYWQFIRCIAQIELYKSGWIEPEERPKLVYDILFYHIMAYILVKNNTSLDNLVKKLLSISIFSDIPMKDFQILIDHMLKTNIIEYDKNKELVLANKGKELTYKPNFSTMFDIDVGSSKDIARWNINTKILKKMREIITGNNQFDYLSPAASHRLLKIRKIIHFTNIFENNNKIDIFALDSQKLAIMPWLGTKAKLGLEYYLKTKGLNILSVDFKCQDVITALDINNKDILKQYLSDISQNFKIENINLPHIPKMSKYSKFLPQELAKKQYLANYVELNQLI